MENKLYVLYDEECALCIKLKLLLDNEGAYTPIITLPMRLAVKDKRFAALKSLIEDGRFVVVSDNGSVYLDSKGRIRILYALHRFRTISKMFTLPIVGPISSLALTSLANSRGFLSLLLSVINRGNKQLSIEEIETTAKDKKNEIAYHLKCDNKSCT
jgi:predicted DCC family thiol-disulfide oxidoreductase YuxK